MYAIAIAASIGCTIAWGSAADLKVALFLFGRIVACEGNHDVKGCISCGLVTYTKGQSGIIKDAF